METSTAIHVKTLLKERDQLVREIEALRNRIVGLEIAINLVSGRPVQVKIDWRDRFGRVQHKVLRVKAGWYTVLLGSNSEVSP